MKVRKKRLRKVKEDLLNDIDNVNSIFVKDSSMKQRMKKKKQQTKISTDKLVDDLEALLK
ncbi:hypothetical protein O9G_004177 [Rozella allomycis CSF55]|uniref:Uncharacterized protein n=1 Tax=Rozella allomycis (strain CSF55) TaxID=988480 RepID=A0A075APG7_ROZAC|nr:hypothetical protein O9G_004177 [Rozella allomycis CSF55]|eukprot:EPZ31986.1 hypothetical protein O9G_004177 [Rozella allomycis CSF55]